MIRFVVNGLKPIQADIGFAWNEIQLATNDIFKAVHQKTIEINNKTNFSLSVQVSNALLNPLLVDKIKPIRLCQ